MSLSALSSLDSKRPPSSRVRLLVPLVLVSTLLYGLLWFGLFEALKPEPSRSPALVASQQAVPPPAQVEQVERAVAPPRPERAEPDQQAQWPPPRAFTARCQAPGGGCVPQCTPLASGKCLDPCFIHTAECSRDCLLPDGSCGWPPSDEQ